MQVPQDRWRLLVTAGVAFIVIGVVLNIIALGSGGEGYFIIFPFAFGVGNGSILVGLLVFVMFLVFFGLFTRWGLAMPERFESRASTDSTPRYCQSCERAVQADAAYCPYCGTLLDAD